MSSAKSASAKRADANAVSTKPSDAELTILQILWRKGPSTAREIHAEHPPETGFTTVQKFLQIMATKGMILPVEEKYAWRYKAIVSQDKIERGLVSNLLKKAFDGSPAKLLMQAMASKKVTAKELAEIKRLCEQHKKT